MRDSFTIRGLYAITPDSADLKILVHKTQLAIQGGAFMVQYRSKIQDHDVKMQQGDAILRLCRNHNVPCIVNAAVLNKSAIKRAEIGSRPLCFLS